MSDFFLEAGIGDAIGWEEGVGGCRGWQTLANFGYVIG